MKSISHSRSGKIPPAEALTPISHQKQKTAARGAKENVDPEFSPLLLENSALRTASAAIKPPLAPKIRSPLHPRPLQNPSDAPLKKKKLFLEAVSENGAPAASASESGVQVIVRMRPLNKEVEEEDQIVQKISPDSVSILDHTFTFDSVADTGSSQEDVFHLVGLPLVENCLAGFNSSIFAYGQTGSGKTYTMWGPSSATMEYGSSNGDRGLTPRVFERLFSRIQEEQIKHSDKQLCYQCRCSFLEIYNEQIMDLLDPSQRNLQIREDVRTGVYVDCLSEEYVQSVKDVTRLLTKGLANIRTGATSVNSESSRSHCVFTCVVESHSKSIADGVTSLKISRINLVDLAGSERQKLTRAAGDRLKEAGNINRSLSQLGNVINILAEISQSGKHRHIPYRDSKLTFLLQESLGGNAKLAMICAISPSQSCKNESFSTLRFAQRAKAIKNTAVVNEISQDDVDALREQIRQLKDELLRMKASREFSTGWNARRSLNLLRMSLGQRVDSTMDDDMDIGDDAGIPKMASEHVEVEGEQVDEKIRAYPAPTEHLAASLQHGLQVITYRHQRLAVGRSLLSLPLMPIPKVDVGVQADVSEDDSEDSSTFVCRFCRERHAENGNDRELQLVPSDMIDNHKDNDDGDRLQLMIADEPQPANLLPKAVEKVLAGAIRREMALQEHCSTQNAEINQLRRLIQQYKHERECNAIIAQSREDKISRLENLMDGVLPTENFMEEEFISLADEHKLLREKYENHPEVVRANIELQKVKEELESYKNFYDLGERDVMMEEMDDLRNQLQCYITSSPSPSQKNASLLQLTCIRDNISHIEELEHRLQESLSLAEKLRMELDSEKRCSDELKEALQTAMKGHARILDQYADLQEKHITVLIRHQQIIEGIEDVKKAAARAGVKGAESRFIHSLAAQVSVLKVERERERKYWREENRALEAQLRDTAEAVQAAGELILRLRDAEKRAQLAEKEVDALKRRQEREMESTPPNDWREVFEDKDEVLFSRGAEQASWFSGYDQCNL